MRIHLSRAFKVTVYTVTLSLIAIMLLITLLLNSNTFQNFVARKATDYLSEAFRTNIHIGRISYHPFTHFVLHEVYFGDHKNDTLFYVQQLKFNIESIETDSLKIALRNVEVDGGYCRIAFYKDATFNIDVLFNIQDSLSKPDTPAIPFRMVFDRVTLKDSRFKFIDESEPLTEKGFDPFNQYFTDVNASVKHFSITDDSLHLDIQRMSFREKSGLKVNQFSANTVISPKGMYFHNLTLKTPYSHLGKQFSMHYNSWDELADFNNSVTMQSNIEHSTIDFKDIAFFVPDSFFQNQKVLLNGKINGSTGNLKGRDIVAKFGKSSLFEGDITVKGLPNVTSLFLDVKANHSITNKKDLDYLLAYKLPDVVSKFGDMKFEGRYTGFYNDFVAFGRFHTAIGQIESDLNMKITDPSKNSSYSGKLKLADFNLGAITDNEKYIGNTSMYAELNGTGLDISELTSTINARIDYLTLNKYTYHSITMNGALNNRIFKGVVNMNDENAIVNFNGDINFREAIPTYHFSAKLSEVNLSKLNLSPVNALFSSDIKIDFAFKDLDHNWGTLTFTDNYFEKDFKEYKLYEIKIRSESSKDFRLVHAKSDIFDIKLSGKFFLLDISNSFQTVLSKLVPAYFKTPVITSKKIIEKQDFNFYLKISNSEILSTIFYPDCIIRGTEIKGNYSDESNNISLTGVSSYVKYGTQSFDNIALKTEISNGDNALMLCNVGQIKSSDSLLMKEVALKFTTSKNTGELMLLISDTSSPFHARILSSIIFQSGTIQASFNESQLSYNRLRSTIISDSKIEYNDSLITFNSFSFKANDGLLTLNGYVDPDDETHSLKLVADNFHLDFLNNVYPSLSYKIAGIANGTIVFRGYQHKNFLNTFLSFSSVAVDNDTLGDFNLNSNYNDKQKRMLLYLKSISGKLKNLECGGYISTETEPYPMNLNVYLAESELKSIQPFIKEYLQLYSGSIQAKCTITGNTENPVIDGSVDLKSVDMLFELLKTRYRFTTSLRFDNDLIELLPCDVSDMFDRKARLNGNITHHGFDTLKYSFSLNQLNGFHLLNTTSKDNSLFYGKAFGSGSLTLTGSTKDLILETNLKTDKGTVIYIPMSSSEVSTDDQLIHFINKDTVAAEVVKKKNILNGFSANCLIEATPDAEIQIVMNELNNDVIKGKGNGNIKLEITRQGQFNLFGEVAIDEGEYRFTVANIFSKKFLLRKGGTITWSGDPLQARLNIEGLYPVRRTSIAELLQSSSSQSNVQVPVECIMYLKGNLLNPDIKFDINLPDLQNTIGGNNVSEIQNSIRTMRNDPDIMNQEVMSLMLFGKFAPINGLTANNASNIGSGVNSTLSDFFSSQANNLIGKIIPGFDVNVDIQTGTETNRTRAIVTASKKFYNNRLEIQSSYDPQFANAASFSGQYSITKDGNLKVKAYNKYSTDLTYSNTNRLTQGVGLYYRKEFDSFIEVFNRRNKQYTTQ